MTVAQLGKIFSPLYVIKPNVHHCLSNIVLLMFVPSQMNPVCTRISSFFSFNIIFPSRSKSLKLSFYLKYLPISLLRVLQTVRPTRIVLLNFFTVKIFIEYKLNTPHWGTELSHLSLISSFWSPNILLRTLFSWPFILQFSHNSVTYPGNATSN
jgi:hypothetical protein